MSSIKVQRDGLSDKFSVSVINPGYGMRGYTVTARNMDEVHECLDHFHGTGPDKDKHALGKCTGTCPFCRQELLWQEQGKKWKCFE